MCKTPLDFPSALALASQFEASAACGISVFTHVAQGLPFTVAGRTYTVTWHPQGGDDSTRGTAPMILRAVVLPSPSTSEAPGDESSEAADQIAAAVNTHRHELSEKFSRECGIIRQVLMEAEQCLTGGRSDEIAPDWFTYVHIAARACWQAARTGAHDSDHLKALILITLALRVDSESRLPGRPASHHDAARQVVMGYLDTPAPCPEDTLQALHSALDIHLKLSRAMCLRHDTLPLDTDISVRANLLASIAVTIQHADEYRHLAAQCRELAPSQRAQLLDRAAPLAVSGKAIELRYLLWVGATQGPIALPAPPRPAGATFCRIAVDLGSPPMPQALPLCDEIAIGDMHGNTRLFLQHLIALGYVRLSEPSAWNALGEKILANDCAGFDALLEQALISNADSRTRRLVPLGDLLGDRVHNDYFMIALIDFLGLNGQDYAIIFSNHDAQFVKYFLHNEKKADDEPYEMPALQITAPQIVSLSRLHASLNETPALRALFVQRVRRSYLGRLHLTMLAANGQTLYAHGLLNHSIFTALTRAAGASEQDPLGSRIDRINTWFQQDVLASSRSFHRHATIRHPGAIPPIACLIWNVGPTDRVLFPRQIGHPHVRDLALPDLEVKQVVHGHTPDLTTRLRDVTKVARYLARSARYLTEAGPPTRDGDTAAVHDYLLRLRGLVGVVLRDEYPVPMMSACLAAIYTALRLAADGTLADASLTRAASGAIDILRRHTDDRPVTGSSRQLCAQAASQILAAGSHARQGGGGSASSQPLDLEYEYTLRLVATQITPLAQIVRSAFRHERTDVAHAHAALLRELTAAQAYASRLLDVFYQAGGDPRAFQSLDAPFGQGAETQGMRRIFLARRPDDTGDGGASQS